MSIFADYFSSWNVNSNIVKIQRGVFMIKYSSRLNSLLRNTGDMALKRRARVILTELNIQKGDSVLDVGCGDGYYTYLLSSLNIPIKMTGTDIDVPALKSAKKNLVGKKVSLVAADLMKKIPFSNNTFNKVVMSEVAEHLPNDVKGLKEVNRVMVPGGTLCLTVPNINYPFFWDPVNWVLQRLFNTHIKSGFWSGIWNQHLRLYSPDEISRVLVKAGFEIEKVESETWWCIPFNHNLINFVARKLYNGKLSAKVTRSVSKFESKSITKPLLIDLGFKFLNLVDTLNNIYQPKHSGVAVFVKARKK